MLRSPFAPILIVALLAPASHVKAEDPTGHALHHHGFYDGLKQPGTNLSCCHDKDCRPAKFRITQSGVQFQIAGKWIDAPAERTLEIDTPDGAGHWCGYGESTNAPHTYCAIVPKGGV